MKLNKEQIHFIDTYLKNSGIEFIDIRMEMLDHIASAVENKMQKENLDFYHAYKNYMVIHKKQHLKANKQFIKTTDKKVLIAIGRFFIKPNSLFLFGLSFLALKIASTNTDITKILKFTPIGVLISLALFYFISYRLGKSERYSGLERIGFILLFIMQLLQFFISPFSQKNLFQNSVNTQIVLVSFIIVLAFTFIQTIIKFKKEYTTLYKNKLA
tara:strand:+ start:6940 stop:7581 length:642 start_codon:yes stop_codon:yes gene_type:complete